MHLGIRAYNEIKNAGDREVCDILATTIQGERPDAQGRICHGHPVCFVQENPIVGNGTIKTY